MKFKWLLFLSSAVTVGLIGLPAQSGHAQTTPAAASQSGMDLQLNPQQRQAIQAIGEFALDQMESLITNGLNPQALNRADVERRSENLRQTLSSLRLDDRQKTILRTILQTARDQMQRQLETR